MTTAINSIPTALPSITTAPAHLLLAGYTDPPTPLIYLGRPIESSSLELFGLHTECLLWGDGDPSLAAGEDGTPTAWVVYEARYDQLVAGPDPDRLTVSFTTARIRYVGNLEGAQELIGAERTGIAA